MSSTPAEDDGLIAAREKLSSFFGCSGSLTFREAVETLETHPSLAAEIFEVNQSGIANIGRFEQ